MKMISKIAGWLKPIAGITWTCKKCGYVSASAFTHCPRCGHPY